MDVFAAGSRVSFFSANGQLVTGIVKLTSRMSDGTQILLIKCDNGRTLSLPAASVFLING
ncbi:hypothetical protein DFS33DRAFT_1368525 [Desarmillaria ectypa]|nr:hypothetical protein DFS33DRAFT_1368525 [Desarmillaria ectypa]